MNTLSPQLQMRPALAPHEPFTALLSGSLGTDDPEPTLPLSWYVALDVRAAARWREANWGAAWQLTCLHSRLDPEPLDWQLLCQGRHLDPDGLQWMDNHSYQELCRSSYPLQVALGRNLWVVHEAIRARQLPTLSSYLEERRWHRHTPLARRVSMSAFCRWAESVGLARTPPWPARQAHAGVVDCAAVEDVFQLPIRNHLTLLLKLVAERFRADYEAGGRRTPRIEDVTRIVVHELGEPENVNRDRLIAQVLKSDDTPHGPRQRRKTA